MRMRSPSIVELHADRRAVVERGPRRRARRRAASRSRARHLAAAAACLELPPWSTHGSRRARPRAREQPATAALVGGHHGLELGHVVVRAARRERARKPAGSRATRLVEAAAAAPPGRAQQHALLLERAWSRRHRARRDAPDVGVVAAAGDEEARASLAVVKTGRHHGDVGQVRAAGQRVVGDHDVARPRDPGSARARSARSRPWRPGARGCAARWRRVPLRRRRPRRSSRGAP